MKIEWTNLATDRVFEIASYIAKDSLREAEKYLTKIYDYVERLESLPESGRYLPELPDRKELRELVFGKYRIIYKIQKTTIYIMTVRRYKQILPSTDLDK